MTNHFVSISRAAQLLGVSEVILRRWDKEGRLPSIKTKGGHRRYDLSHIKPETVHKFDVKENRKTLLCFLQDFMGHEVKRTKKYWME